MREPLPIIDETAIPKHCVFIVSDGARYDYLERFHIPHLSQLINAGVSYRNMVAATCFAGTNPGLATLATGAPVKDHGIPSSYEWFDKAAGKLIYFYDSDTDSLHMDLPTVGDLLKRTRPNAKVASISTKDRHAILLGGRSSDLIAYTYRESVFKRDVLGPYTGAGVSTDFFTWSSKASCKLPLYLQQHKQKRIVDWSGSTFMYQAVEVADTPLIDGFIVDGALKLLENEKPDMLFVGMVSLNIVAHLHGTNGPEIADAVEYTDVQIGRLIAKVKELGRYDDTLWVVTSDHGMSERPIGVDVQTLLRKNGHGDVIDNVLYFSSGGTGGMYLKDTRESKIQTAIAAVKELKHIQGAWYKYDEKAPMVVRNVAHENTPDIIIIPDYDAVVLDEGKEVPTVAFYHGPPYPPDLNIWCIFSGPGVRKLGAVGERLDYSSREILSDDELAGLPRQEDVAQTVKAIMKI